MTCDDRLKRDRAALEELARGWGELLATEAFPEGVGMDVDLFAMEEVAIIAARALVRGAVESMTAQQAARLDREHPCPGCGKLCRLDHRQREVQVRGGSAALPEPRGHCSTCRRDFFPSASGAEDRRSSL